MMLATLPVFKETSNARKAAREHRQATYDQAIEKYGDQSRFPFDINNTQGGATPNYNGAIGLSRADND